MVYVAVAGEKVTLSGGRRLEGGRWGRVQWPPQGLGSGQPRGEGWELQIPATFRRGRTTASDEAAKARRVPHRVSARLHGRLPQKSDEAIRLRSRGHRSRPDATFGTWRSSGSRKWLDNRLPIESVDAKSRTVTFDRPACSPSSPATVARTLPGGERRRGALETPGQWYLGPARESSTICHDPVDEMPSAEIIAPRLLGRSEIRWTP